MTSRRRVLPVLIVLVLLASGCGFFGEGADARKAADKLASALQQGDLGKIPFTEDAAGARKAYTELVAPLKDFDTKVVVDQVTRSGEEANVRLAWTQSLDGVTWTHRTKARLTRVDDVWRTEWKPAVLATGLGQDEKLNVSRIKPERGDILGADDQPIVVPRPVMRFGIDKTRVSGASAITAARRLANLLDLDAAAFQKAVQAAGAKAFVQAVAIRREQVSQRVLGSVAAIKGARGIADRLPLAPTKEFAAQLIGTVGPVTAELVDKSEGRLRAGDDSGLSGLQLRYDEQLFGTPGVKVSTGPKVLEEASDLSIEPETLFEAEPVDGEDLHLSLDVDLQREAERLLGGIGPASAVVAIRPSSGEVLAAASGPGSKGQNTATFGQYAPGSTFKVVSALALLRHGTIPSSFIPCTPTITVDGKQFKNYSDYPSSGLGQITLRTALANSCNTAFISQRDDLRNTSLTEAAAALGIGKDYDVGFPAYFGQVPPPASETEKAADMIGQGKVLVSPLAMAGMVASVVNGAVVLPSLVSGSDDPPEATPGKPLTKVEATALRRMMHAVVESGSGIGLRDLQPPEVIAKTGTAEYGETPPLPTHAWMIGAQGDLAVAVFVATGQSGSSTAGPILESFLRFAR